ncbi:MAG: DUF4330 domain-containing protein [Pseudarthrobacter sp.]
MRILDDKGRLFGKVNLLDLVVVLAILGVAGLFGYKQYVGRQVVAVGEDRLLEITMRFPAVAQPTIDYVLKDTDLFDSKSNTLMGKVVGTRVEPATVVVHGDDGRIHYHKSPDRFDFYVTVQGRGHVTRNSITMAGLEIKIGRQNYVRNKYWAGIGATWDINEDPQPR